jgi:L-fuculose-phosphate aldolase
MIDKKNLRIEVATCCCIVEYLGLFDFSGHISARIQGTDSILINSRDSVRSTIDVKDIIKTNLKGNVSDKRVRPPTEVFIHTSIYRRRPDVNAVAHLHSPATTMLSVTKKNYVPVIWRGAIFGEGVSLYDDCRTIKLAERGDALAEALGQKRAVIMRGHGAVVVAESVKALLYYSISLELNTRNQLAAYQMGCEPDPLLDEELAEGKQRFGTKRLYDKAWSYYLGKLDRQKG